MDIIEGLQNLGLNQKEARVYTNLLQSGEATAYTIAEISGLKRPTVYVVLDELRRKGLVLKIPHAKKQIFQAKSPQEFFAETEDRLERTRSILPQLIALSKSEERPKTYLFDGVEGYKESLYLGYEDVIGKEIVAFFSKRSDNTIKVEHMIDKYFSSLEKDNIKVRAVIPAHESVKGEQGKYKNVEIKSIPIEKYCTDDAILVEEKRVKIFSKDL